MVTIFQWYDGRTLRERIVLLCALLIAVTAGMQLIVFGPLVEKTNSFRRDISSAEVALADLEARKIVLEQQQNIDPNRDQREKLKILLNESAKLQQQLSATIDNLVMPEQMTALLKKILESQHGLTLLRLKNLPAEKVTLTTEKTEESAPVLYRHPFEMELSGNYRALLDYLEVLEDLPREMGWETVAIETREYPDALIRLRVFTLSLREDWIGG